MKIQYLNNFGKFTQNDFAFTCVVATVADNEHSIAMEQGFLLRQNQWRQCRSTRVQLNKTDYSLIKTARLLTDYNYDQLLEINEQYLLHKHFALSPYDSHISPTDVIWGYYDNEYLVAWSKIHQYVGELETAYFAWDYVNPKLSLGILSLKHEIAWAKSLGYKHLYLGPGYESCSIYKSQINGFEWWSGSEWSQDAEQYAWLCERETSVNTFKEFESIIYNTPS